HCDHGARGTWVGVRGLPRSRERPAWRWRAWPRRRGASYLLRQVLAHDPTGPNQQDDDHGEERERVLVLGDARERVGAREQRGQEVLQEAEQHAADDGPGQAADAADDGRGERLDAGQDAEDGRLVDTPEA